MPTSSSRGRWLGVSRAAPRDPRPSRRGNPVSKRLFSGARLAASGLALVALIAASAGPVAADTTPPGDVTYSQNGSNAELYSSDCSTDGDITTCADQQLYAFVGKMTDSATGVVHASQLCAALSHYAYSESTGEYVGTPTYEQGCRVDLPAGTIRIDGKLNSASVAPTTVAIEDLACSKFGCEPGAGRDVVVGASWAGFGPLRTSKSRSASDDGTCRSQEAFKGSSREADASGSIDGQVFGGDRFAVLSAGKYSFRS